MTEPLLISRQRTALHDLCRAIATRARETPRIEREFRERSEAIEREFQESTQRVITRFEAEKDAAQTEWQETQERVNKRFTAERAAQDRELEQARQRIATQFTADSNAARAEYQKIRASLAATLEAKQKAADQLLEEAQNRTTEALRQAQRLEHEVAALLQGWRQERDYGPKPDPKKKDRPIYDAFRVLDEHLEDADAQLARLRALRLPRLFAGLRLLWLGLAAALAAAGVGYFFAPEEHRLYGPIIGAAAGIVLDALVLLWLYLAARAQIVTAYQPFRQALVEVDVAREKAREQARDAHQKKVTNDKKLHDQELGLAGERLRKKQTAAQERRDRDSRAAQEKYDHDVADSTQRRDTDLRQAHEKYQRLRTESLHRYETESQQIHQRHFQQTSENRQRYEQEWAALSAAWQQALAAYHAVAEEVSRESAALFPPWPGPAWQSWQPPAAVPPVLRFGDYRVDLAALPDGLPEDPRLQPAVPTAHLLPALVPFPSRCSLLLRTGQGGRAEAIAALQAVMLRYLTTLPPGKVRFTIIDPAGLGENFASFMHLADYDEQLVTSKIWTEPAHIEQRMLDLTEHLENVLQKYLRDEYQTIEEYNREAGEVAEPFRILVVANFPTNFSSEAARRLLSIASSGVRCGVFTLVSVDTTLEMPHNFTLAHLEQTATNLEWQGNRFVWKDADFEQFPLTVEAPPPSDFSKRLLHAMGQKAQEANRVEVPFEFIAPPAERWWSADSRGGVDVPLGKAGATKRQHLALGKGTSQHVLIAGKTGSGKSTLLHALITNAALSYSPDELELYLIDFKKGVEFKTYAAHELPHARVVAVESDREFGLSVLQRLDVELKRRGELFRQVNAQDLRSYREANGTSPLPRILLIVDEFQEFFVEDDKVAHEATQLFDRLVRQGRAFGLHVLLGSQTLGGAFSLARSTIDQMAVRIALQCSEADGHLILSDDNSAARLLSRPGEAIYNDANGLVEGNHPFQVVWLADSRREEYLRQLRDMDRQRSPQAARTQIVFEGNALADLGKNLLLRQVLASPAWPAAVRSASAWLGEAMAIKDPTAAVFRRQSGSNLLLVGQQDETALALLATAVLCLAAQHPPATDAGPTAGGCFYILDGSPADHPHAGTFTRLAARLPHAVKVAGPRDLGSILGALGEELERRQKTNEVEGPSLYLLIYGLHRFRDLRRAEDDFGFGRGEEKPSPPKQLAALLREGSSLGIHVLAWCDTYNNATRALDRQGMREFDMRVLFQMSAADSGNLIDSPLASRLGQHRALFHSEEEGRQEKFRPYGLPTEEWLGWVRQQLSHKRVAEPDGTPPNCAPSTAE